MWALQHSKFCKLTFLYTKYAVLVARSKISYRENCRPQNHQHCAGNNFEHQTCPLQILRPFESITHGREIMVFSLSAHVICCSQTTSLGMYHLHLFYKGNLCQWPCQGQGCCFWLPACTFQPCLQGLAQPELK